MTTNSNAPSEIPEQKTSTRLSGSRVLSRGQSFVGGVPNGTISLKNKLALTIGSAPATVPLVTSTMYISMFLLNVARIQNKFATIIVVFARFSDAISDPAVGALVNKTQEKGGTLRKWMICALPFTVVSFLFLWLPPHLPTPGKFIYYLVFYISLQIAFTLYNIPFTSLVMYQSTDRVQRDTATSFRLAGEIFWTLFSVGLVQFAQLVIPPGVDLEDCKLNTTVSEETISRYQDKYMLQGGLGAATILLTGVACYFMALENTDIHIEHRTGLLKSFKQAMSFPPFAVLVFAYLMGYVAMSIIQGALLFYFKYVLFKESLFEVIMLVLMTSGATSIVLWQFLSKRMGKRNTSFCSVVITIPAFASLFVITENFPEHLLVLSAIIIGPGLVCGFYIPWVLLPDVIDAYTVKYGQRNESIFMGVFVFVSKLAGSLVTMGVLHMLESLDYDPRYCKQDTQIMYALRVLCSFCPATLMVVYAVVMCLFPLSEQEMEKNRDHLTQLANAKIEDYKSKSISVRSVGRFERSRESSEHDKPEELSFISSMRSSVSKNCQFVASFCSKDMCSFRKCKDSEANITTPDQADNTSYLQSSNSGRGSGRKVTICESGT